MVVNESISSINHVIGNFILLISTWSGFRTIKEGKKAEEEMKKETLNDHLT